MPNVSTLRAMANGKLVESHPNENQITSIEILAVFVLCQEFLSILDYHALNTSILFKLFSVLICVIEMQKDKLVSAF